MVFAVQKYIHCRNLRSSCVEALSLLASGIKGTKQGYDHYISKYVFFYLFVKDIPGFAFVSVYM
jgi:hypothetical protein